jgi:hypothetical protein
MGFSTHSVRKEQEVSTAHNKLRLLFLVSSPPVVSLLRCTVQTAHTDNMYTRNHQQPSTTTFKNTFRRQIERVPLIALVTLKHTNIIIGAIHLVNINELAWWRRVFGKKSYSHGKDDLLLSLPEVANTTAKFCHFANESLSLSKIAPESDQPGRSQQCHINPNPYRTIHIANEFASGSWSCWSLCSVCTREGEDF